MSLTPEQLAKPLKVSRRIQETKDSVSLILEIPPDLKPQFQYQAGQFVTFFLKINGQPINRSYSISSSPLCDQDFQVTIKKVTNGLGSVYLCDQVREGDLLLTTPPSGRFFRDGAAPKGTHYFLFGAGSGITPLFSILKTTLMQNPLNRVTLVYSNRNEDTIIYKNDLNTWATNHASRLDVIHILSNPSESWPARRGRLSNDLLREIIEMPTSPIDQTRAYYLCGPRDFMDFIRSTLVEHGVATADIHREDFGGSSSHPKVAENEGWTFIGPSKASETPERIVAEINGKTFEVTAKEGQTILETLLESGAQPPYSCMDGACMACLGKIEEGRVYQEDPGILIDENIKNNECLTCQAKPLSRVVKVSYDKI